MNKSLATLLLASLSLPLAAETSATLDYPYENPAHIDIEFGQRSFYLQPWRAYMDTWDGSRFIKHLGIVSTATPDETRAELQMFAEAGFGTVRMEFGWGHTDYDNPLSVSAGDKEAWTKRLLAAKAAGMRPLILLNGHHGMPCPVRFHNVTIAADAAAGAREITLSSVDNIKPHYTGLPDYSVYKRPGVYITAVDPETRVATLGKPLHTDLRRGQSLDLATTLYRPFSGATFADGTPNPAAMETVNGWLTYVRAICEFAKEVMGGTGFDVEVWNEYSFGSDFLDIKNYYDPPPQFKDEVTYTKHGRTAKGVEIILPMTIDYIADPANKLPGVRVISGFANQRPFDNGTEAWPGLHANSRHYYNGIDYFPGNPDRYAPRATLDALGKLDGEMTDEWMARPGTYFVPDVMWNLPEYWHTGAKVEFMTRDTQPLKPVMWGTHHRYSHPGTGKPPELWMTEVNFCYDKWMHRFHAAGIDDNDPRLVKLRDDFNAKNLLRAAMTHSHKGLHVITYFSSKNSEHGAEKWMGIVPNAFYEQINKDNLALTDAARALRGETLNSSERERVRRHRHPPQLSLSGDLLFPEPLDRGVDLVELPFVDSRRGHRSRSWSTRSRSASAIRNSRRATTSPSKPPHMVRAASIA